MQKINVGVYNHRQILIVVFLLAWYVTPYTCILIVCIAAAALTSTELTFTSGLTSRPASIRTTEKNGVADNLVARVTQVLHDGAEVAVVARTDG